MRMSTAASVITMVVIIVVMFMVMTAGIEFA